MKQPKFNVRKFFDEEAGCSSSNKQIKNDESGESRGKHWMWTLNNPTPEEIAHIRNSTEFSWLMFQGEVGEQGTPHLQGTCSFEKVKRFRQVKKILGPRASFELRRGTVEEAAKYCSKDATYDESVHPKFESGSRPCNQGARTDVLELSKRIRSGATEAQLFADFPALYLRYTRGIRDAIRVSTPPRDHKTEVYWYWGPTGTGKSDICKKKLKDPFWKSGDDNWWDGYQAHEIVIIDDYRPCMCRFNFLLRLLDRYPLLVPTKGGFAQFVAKEIYITAPSPPREMWAGRIDEDLKQLERRINKVIHFHTLLRKPNENNES